jgi:hypothetical protein
MTTNNPQLTVQRMCEAFAKSDLDRLLETVHPHSRWTYVGVRIRGQQNAPTSAGKVLGSFSAKSFKI